ncbi:MAG: signal peptidase I [Lachnospiraceae bacterium]|nr:signal peptidase I [Lachnospiraceae bacterium]
MRKRERRQEEVTREELLKTTDETDDAVPGDGGLAEGEERNVLREVLGFLAYAAVIFGCTFFIIMFVAQRTSVSGHSMDDNLQDGDQLILEKVSYRFRDPARFDIVVFRFAHEKNTFFIKRIIGLPGETVQIIGDDIYIDGEILEEDYGLEPIQDPMLAAEPITLGEDEYFVLGDNRNHSSDSRDPSVANVKRSQIVGRAWLRIWPLDRLGFVSHR